MITAGNLQITDFILTANCLKILNMHVYILLAAFFYNKGNFISFRFSILANISRHEIKHAKWWENIHFNFNVMPTRCRFQNNVLKLLEIFDVLKKPFIWIMTSKLWFFLVFWVVWGRRINCSFCLMHGWLTSLWMNYWVENFCQSYCK